MIAKIAALLLFGVCVMCQQRLDCQADELQSCIKLADPLLKDPKYVFPSNKQDINHVCNVLFPRTWSNFVSCIRRYTDTCLTQDQRGDFNRAVGDSINSVHKMCTNDDYQADYLQHAECIKEKSTDEIYCGTHYNLLVQQVQGSREASKQELCCSHNSFKECVLAETEQCRCEGENCRDGMSAKQFARTMLDKALGFLLKQCNNYVPNSSDCAQYVHTTTEKPFKQPRFDDQIDPLVEDTNIMTEEEKRIAEEEKRYEEGNYFPSGTREDQRWEDKTERPEIPNNVPRDVDNQLNNEQVTNSPIQENYAPPQEEERPRRPWLPETEIKSFDDIFSNVVDHNGLASGLSSAASNMKIASFIVTTFVLVVLAM